MPITPDDMPDMDDDAPSRNQPSAPRSRAKNPANDSSLRAANGGQNDSDEMLDDAGDIDSLDGEDMQEAPASFSDLVRQAPLGALVGAFIAGFLVARIL